MNPVSLTLDVPDEVRLGHLAKSLRQHLQAPLVIYLKGELGSGKTTFVRALMRQLGYSGRVKSPSYGLLEPYSAGGFNILHLDLYRIENPAELDYLAIRDLFDSKSLLLIEWPEKGAGFLHPADLEFNFSEANGQHRLHINTCTQPGETVLRSMQKDCNMQFLA